MTESQVIFPWRRRGSCGQILKKHGTFRILFRFFYREFSRCIHCQSLIFSGCFQRMQHIAMQRGMSRLFQLSFPNVTMATARKHARKLDFRMKMYFSFLRMARQECLLVFPYQNSKPRF